MLKKHILAGAVAAASILSVAAPAFASNGRFDEGSMKIHTSSSTPVVINVACVSTALDKRDGAIGTAFDAQTSSVKAALTARTSALKAAYALTDKTARRTAIRAAWQAWSTAVRTAKSTQKTARNTAWTTFRTDMKACGAQGIDSTGSSVDASL